MSTTHKDLLAQAYDTADALKYSGLHVEIDAKDLTYIGAVAVHAYIMGNEDQLVITFFEDRIPMFQSSRNTDLAEDIGFELDREAVTTIADSWWAAVSLF